MVFPRTSCSAVAALLLWLTARPAAADPAATRVLVIADNQFHVPIGQAYYLQNGIVDQLVSVAIRPAQSTIFGPAAFEALLHHVEEGAPVLHLGDASDVSCPAEMERFLAIMKRSGRTWLFAPGNHDGCFTGNSNHRPRNLATWDRVCGGTRLDKAEVVARYLEARFGARVDEGEQRGSVAPATPGGPEISWAARVDRGAPERSFLVQQMRLGLPGGGFARFVLLDTVQYQAATKYVLGALLPKRYVAGVTGQLLDDQKAIAESWMSQGQATGDRLILAGHHPLKSSLLAPGLNFGDSKWVRDRLRRYGGRLYLSAHTHQGGLRRLSGAPDAPWELNVASLVDWPLGLRTLALEAGALRSSEIVFDRESDRLGNIGGSCDSRRAEWRTGRGVFEWYTDYLAHRSGPTGRIVNHYLLIAELHSLREAIWHTSERRDDPALLAWLAATDQQLTESRQAFGRRYTVRSREEIERLARPVAEALARYDAQRAALSDPGRERAELYAWCQAWWAAEADKARQEKVATVVGQRYLERGWRDLREVHIPFE